VVYLGTLRVPWASAVVPYLSPSEMVEGTALAGAVITHKPQLLLAATSISMATPSCERDALGLMPCLTSPSRGVPALPGSSSWPPISRD